MKVIRISILLVLSIFATISHVWSGPEKLMKDEANGATTVKMHENKGLLQKKWKPVPKSNKSPKKRGTPSQSTLCPNDGPITGSIKRDMDFLKAVEAKRETRWIGLDEIISSVEFLPINFNSALLSSPEALAGKTSSKPFPASIQSVEGGTRLETFRRLELKKEELLKEIFMGLRFSFTSASRQMVLELNVAPLSEKVPGLIIPF